MTDEERIAYIKVKDYVEDRYGSLNMLDLITVLNLIEKQQKEIESLKEINNETVTQIYNRCSKKFKDKIKAEIEEQKNMRVDGEVFATSVNYAIKVLQSLLEKE